MQNQHNRPRSGAKAIAIDPKEIQARYRIAKLQVTALLLSAIGAIILQIIFGR